MSDALTILATGILILCVCVGFSYCAKTEIEVELKREQLKVMQAK